MSEPTDEEIDVHLEAWANLTDEQLREVARLRQDNERLRAALTEITELELEGDASLDDAIVIAQEALEPEEGQL